MDKLKASFQKILETIKEKWAGLSKNARLVTLAVSVSVVVALIALIALSSRTNYDVLFTNVSESDMNEVSTILGLSGIDYSITDHGSTIKVAADDLNEARMSLAVAGYPRAGTDYSHWEESVGLFSTDFEKKEAKRQQLEIRIQDTLRMLKKVDNAVVTITLPGDKSYVINTDNEPSQASVMLVLRPGESLTTDEIKGVQALVLSAVPQLTLEELRLVDQNSIPLIPEDTSSAEAQLLMETQRNRAQRQYQKDFEADIESKVAGLLEGTVRGFTVSASALFDFSDWTNQSTIYTGSNIDPETGMQSGILDNSEIKQAFNGIVPEGGVPGTALNADISPNYPTFIGEMEGEVYYEYFQNMQYLVNEDITQSASNGAVLENISLAVQIDEANLTQDEIDNYEYLLSRAINTDVENVAVRAGVFRGLTTPDVAHGGTVSGDRNVLVFIIISLGVLLIVLFLLAIMSSGSKKKRLVRARAAAMQGAGGTPAFADEGGFGSFPIGTQDDDDESLKIQSLMGSSDGDTREALIKNEIREFAQTNPEIVAQLIRSWMKE